MKQRSTNISPFPDLSADHIKTIALTLLNLQGYEVWRQNNIAVKGRKNNVRKGVSDILGYHRKEGTVCACEVKTLNDRLSDDQREFLQGVHDAGGTAFIAMQKGSQVQLISYIDF